MNTTAPKIMGEEVVHEGRFLTTKKLVLSNGGSYEMVSRIGNKSAVAGIIRHRETQKLIFIEQFRYPVRKRVLELVAGVCDKDASLEEIMREEVIEETGYRDVDSIVSLGEFTNSAGLTSETTHLFSIIVSGERGAQQLSELENIQIHEIPEPELLEFITEKQRQGLLLDGKILAALFLSRDHIDKILSL